MSAVYAGVKPSEVGRTLHIVGDTQWQVTNPDQFTERRQRITRADMLSDRVPQCPNRLQVGDLTEYGIVDEYAKVLPWMGSLAGENYYVVGNHDMFPGPSDATLAASRMGMPAKDYAVDLGYALLVSVGPDDLRQATACIYEAPTLAWLDATLAAATKPVIIATHAPLRNTVLRASPPVEQVDSIGDAFYAENDLDIRAAVEPYPNVVLWASGHTHSPINSENIAKVETIGANSFVALNASALAYTGANKKDWTSRLVTNYATFTDDSVTIRWRDHGARQWVGAGRDGHRFFRFTN